MDAVIIYLKDGKTGKSEVVVEIIGDPRQSLTLCNSLLNIACNDPVTDFVKNNEFTQNPPTEWMQ
jgi:hypothetical protein